MDFDFLEFVIMLEDWVVGVEQFWFRCGNFAEIFR